MPNTRIVKHKRLIKGLPVKAGQKGLKGEIVLRDPATGMCYRGAVINGYVAVGVAQADYDNTLGGADGDVLVDVVQGIFVLDNSGTNGITNANVTGTSYVEGPTTVGNAAAGKSTGGPIIGLGWDGLQGVQIKIES